MEYAISIILGTVAIFLALFVYMAVSPKSSKRMLATSAVISVLGGLLIYGFCFASLCSNPLQAMLETCGAVCKMFLGESSRELVQDAAILQTPHGNFLFACVSFLAIFASAGAAVSAIGAGFLRKIRLRLRRRTPVHVLLHLSVETLEMLRLLTGKKQLLVAISENPDPALVQSAEELGCQVYSDAAALDAQDSFLRRIGVSKQKKSIYLYALTNEPLTNLQWAKHMADALQRRQVSPERTSLTLFGSENDTRSSLQADNDHYGFGTVLSVDQSQLAARLLMKKSPLWQAMRFDHTGKATEDFRALVVGSGNAGQAVIQQLVMNGQFAGSRFTLTVFDPHYENIMGQMQYECPQLFEDYAIETYAYDARSAQMYKFLKECHKTLKYIVICTGCDNTNREVAQQLCHFLNMQANPLPVHVCSSRGLQKLTSTSCESWGIYTPEMLCTEQMDRVAMLLNDRYCQNDMTPEENWKHCDFFSRMSCRASADYAPTFLRMAGLSEAADGQWVSGELLENMAISEHLRWCAFHCAMGFQTMSEEEFQRRSKIYLEEKAKLGSSRYRIGKDLNQRLHACLIPWEKLDALSERENAITGGHVDYKAMDRDNVLMLPELLKES